MAVLSTGRFLAVYCVLLCLLTSTLTDTSKAKLHVLVLTPFHSAELSQFGWDGGPAIVPAARLAAKQINSNENILPDHELVLVEESISCHDKLERQGRLQNVYARQILYGANILGIVGPTCSVNSIHLGKLSTPARNPLVQVTIASSPVLENRADFPFTFSTLSSGIRFLRAMKQLAEQENWKSIGVILDVTSTYWLSLNQHVSSVFAPSNISIETFLVEDGYEYNQFVRLAGPQIVNKRLRIFIVMLSRNTADKFICFAYRYSPQLIYEHAQWFFIERSLLFNPNTESPCSNSELEKAFENTVFLQYQLDRNKNKPLNISGQLYESFNESYPTEVRAYENETGLRVFEQYPHGIPYAPVFYDAVWAFAKGLDRVVRNGTLDLNVVRKPGGNDSLMLAKTLQEAILSLESFEGVSGTIEFDRDTGQTNTIITFKQVINGTLQLIGTSADNHINGTFVKGSFPKEHDVIEPWVASLVLILVGILFLVTLFVHMLNLWYSKLPSIKATSPRLNNLIFLGCYLVLLGMILLTVVDVSKLQSHDNYQLLGDILCNIYVWLVEVGVTLVVATVLVKTFRIYRIFIHFTKPGGFFLRDSVMALCTLALLLPVVVVLVVITTRSGTNSRHIWNEAIYLDGLVEHARAMCTVDIWEEVVLKLYVALLLIVSLSLSLPLRHINRQFKTVKSISILTFCQILITWIGYPLAFVASLQIRWDVHIRYLILIIILTGILLSCLLLLFVPPIVGVLKEKLKTTRRNKSQILAAASKLSVFSN